MLFRSRNYLNANEFARYSSILRRAGIPGWQVEHYRPWLASVLLGLAYLHPKEFTVLEGADESLSHYAKENGKDIRYLEKVRDQLALIMTGDEHGQVLALRNLLLHLQGSRQQELDLREAWASGDPEKFSALIDSYFARRPDAREILIDRRNRAWSGTLQSLLESGGTAFVTVGAAHIGGAQGLLSLMCNQGFTIRRVGENGGTDSNACGPKA